MLAFFRGHSVLARKQGGCSDFFVNLSKSTGWEVDIACGGCPERCDVDTPLEPTMEFPDQCLRRNT